MEATHAVASLSALAHEGRLKIFRELVQVGPNGVAAGELARRVGVAPSTLSASLTVLAHADLVSSRRLGRSILYAAAFERMTDLLSYLVKDCCNGRPEVCAPLAAIADPLACCA